MTYRKWDLGWAGLDPSVGHEQAGRRPVLVLSEAVISRSIGLVAIVPLTTWKKGRRVSRLESSTAGLPRVVRSAIEGGETPVS